MKIEIDLGDNKSRWLTKSRSLALCLRPILDALVTVNLEYLKHHNVPKLYESGVRYRNEDPRSLAMGIEKFDPIPIVLKRGHGDCDDLAPWRVAELRHNGYLANIRVQWKRTPSGKLYHILVRREDGTLEDPSKILGM